jgi:hypothetical protein
VAQKSEVLESLEEEIILGRKTAQQPHWAPHQAPEREQFSSPPSRSHLQARALTPGVNRPGKVDARAGYQSCFCEDQVNLKETRMIKRSLLICVWFYYKTAMLCWLSALQDDLPRSQGQGSVGEEEVLAGVWFNQARRKKTAKSWERIHQAAS